jgi:hypothetical protein
MGHDAAIPRREPRALKTRMVFIPRSSPDSMIWLRAIRAAMVRACFDFHETDQVSKKIVVELTDRTDRIISELPVM